MADDQKKYRGFMTVDYDDGSASTFRGIIVTYGDKEKLFNTGDPLIDWYDYYKFVYNGEATEEGILSIVCSSSVDHWFMDTNIYREKYLNVKTMKFLRQPDIDKLSFDELNHELKCVVKKGIKSFNDLKEYYKKYKANER